MPSLDNYGKIDTVSMVFYLPVFAVCLVLAFRHGFGRSAGWIFLCTFSLSRIIGGALMIAAELTRPINTNLYIGAFILEAAGLSPLLLATLGFLWIVGRNSFGNDRQSMLLFHALHLLAIAGLALSMYGGSNAGSSDPDKLKNSNTFRHIATILFAVLYVLLALLHIVCWLKVKSLPTNHRTLLIAISCALPFLGIRMLYSILSTFSGSLFTTSSSTPNTNSLAKFNMASGDWRIYLVMSVIMEFIVTVVYTTAGARIPLHQDYLKDELALRAAPPKTAYAAPVPYAPVTAYDPESQAPYRTQEHLIYTPPPASKY